MNKFIALLRHRISDAKRIREDGMVTGQIPDYAAYRHEAGFIQGLNEALELIQEVEKELVND